MNKRKIKGRELYKNFLSCQEGERIFFNFFGFVIFLKEVALLGI